MKKVKYLILGGGVTGLSFANFIKSDDYLIIEKENRLGGYCKTTYFDEYIWDYAGHFFHFKTDFMKNYFEQMMDQEEIICSEKNTKILYKNNYIDFPFQKNIHQLPKEEFIDCIYDLFNKSEGQVENFKDMIYKNFGKSIANKFLIPYNEKLYACDLNILDKDAMGRFFPYANEREIINNFKNSNNESYNGHFLYPKKGAQYFIDLLESQCIKDNISLNEEVIEINYKDKIVRTTCREINYEYLISSIPLNNLLSLSHIVEEDEIKQNLSGNKVLVFNIGFDKKGIEDVHWVYFPEEKYNFYRVGFYDNILKTDKMSIYVEIGVNSEAEIDVDVELENVIKGLKECNFITNHKIVGYETIIMKPAYAHISEKGKKFIIDQKQKLEQEKIYIAGRYGEWKYCSIEDSMIDALNIANKLNG